MRSEYVIILETWVLILSNKQIEGELSDKNTGNC